MTLTTSIIPMRGYLRLPATISQTITGSSLPKKKYQQTVWNHMERHSNVVLLEIYKKELENEIEELLDTLSPRQKEVYILSRRNGLSLDEIAERLKISPNTAKNHLVQALKVIRNGLEGQHPAVYLLFA